MPLLDHDGIRELFLSWLKRGCSAKRVRLLAWVLIPEHVHLLVFPEGEADMAAFTHALKRPVAEAVLRRWKQLKAPILNRIAHAKGHRFWQTGGGYDRNLFEPEAVRQKIQYMHGNPVRRGLVAEATDYAWSSARWYAGLENSKIACGELPW